MIPYTEDADTSAASQRHQPFARQGRMRKGTRPRRKRPRSESKRTKLRIISINDVYELGNLSALRTLVTTGSFETRGDIVETHFGQGRVRSQVHYDKVVLGSLQVSRQSVLLMQQNDLRGFAEASYDAVMGLGMQTNARSNDTDLSLMSSLGTNTVGVCYGQRDGDPGRLQVGGRVGARCRVHAMPCARAHIAAHEVGTEIADGGVVDRYRERLLVSEPFPHLQRRELGAWLHSDQRPVGHSAGV